MFMIKSPVPDVKYVVNILASVLSQVERIHLHSQKKGSK